jgi:flagellar basal body P-ring protein FlgI
MEGINRMSRISKLDAFQCVVEAMDKNDYKTANEIMNIINRALTKDKKNNTVSSEIELRGMKEEKYFKSILKQ